jgi:cobalt/nickel transport system permease protein
MTLHQIMHILSTNGVNKSLCFSYRIDEKKIPLMGIMGAFIFAAQMINFSIPGTGSSGHLAGGLILAAVLGPYGGFLCMAAILLIQALVFADGGLLAYGCNVFNLGFFPSFIVFMFIVKPLLSKKRTFPRILAASLAGAIVSLQLGAFSVVVETLLSGRTELPFGTFVLLMQPIHLAIGVVEGLITAAILSFVFKARPEILESVSEGKPPGSYSIRNIIIVLVIATVVTGGVLSWFASAYPDGLEWSMMKTSGREELEAPRGLHETMSSIQDNTALLPDYGFKPAIEGETGTGDVSSWPAPSAGTTVSGIIGSSIVFVLSSVTGLVIWLFKRRKKAGTAG